MLPDLRRDTVKLGNLLSVAEQIQTFALGRKTGEIYITSVPAPARINLVEGAVVDAQFGLLSGLEAAIALINLPDPECEFIIGEVAQRRTIDMPYVQVLCEAARIFDEAGRSEAPVLEPKPSTLVKPFLRIKLGTKLESFPLSWGLTYVGRALDNEIILNDPTVSQRHASLDYSDRGVLLKDLDSTNGTYLAGQPLRERWLYLQDNVQFGSVRCLFLDEASEPSGLA